MEKNYGEKTYTVRGKSFTVKGIREVFHIDQRLRIIVLLNSWKTPKLLGFDTPLTHPEMKFLFPAFYQSVPRAKFLKAWEEYNSSFKDYSDVVSEAADEVQ